MGQLRMGQFVPIENAHNLIHISKINFFFSNMEIAKDFFSFKMLYWNIFNRILKEIDNSHYSFLCFSLFCEFLMYSIVFYFSIFLHYCQIFWFNFFHGSSIMAKQTLLTPENVNKSLFGALLKFVFLHSLCTQISPLTLCVNVPYVT